jgi:hypothetical protein
MKKKKNKFTLTKLSSFRCVFVSKSLSMQMPWSGVFLAKLVDQLAKNFPALYGSRKFIVIFTRPAKNSCPDSHKSSSYPHTFFLLRS